MPVVPLHGTMLGFASGSSLVMGQGRDWSTLEEGAR